MKVDYPKNYQNFIFKTRFFEYHKLKTLFRTSKDSVEVDLDGVMFLGSLITKLASVCRQISPLGGELEKFFNFPKMYPRKQ